MDSSENNEIEPESQNEQVILSSNEKRIFTNLRRYAKMYPYSDLAVLFKIHDGELKHALLCLGKGADSNIKL